MFILDEYEYEEYLRASNIREYSVEIRIRSLKRRVHGRTILRGFRLSQIGIRLSSIMWSNFGSKRTLVSRAPNFETPSQAVTREELTQSAEDRSTGYPCSLERRT
jgi:hypothetical protein